MLYHSRNLCYYSQIYKQKNITISVDSLSQFQINKRNLSIFFYIHTHISFILNTHMHTNTYTLIHSLFMFYGSNQIIWFNILENCFIMLHISISHSILLMSYFRYLLLEIVSMRINIYMKEEFNMIQLPYIEK